MLRNHFVDRLRNYYQAASMFTRLPEVPFGRGLGKWRAAGEYGHHVEKALCSRFSKAGAGMHECSGFLDVLVTVELSEGSLFHVCGGLVFVGSQL